MPKLDLSAIPVLRGTSYPPPHDGPVKARSSLELAAAAGLTQFGANLITLPPGTWSSQRHWHSDEDEFVYLVAGEAVLVTDSGRQTLGAGDCAAFKAGDRDGHHLINESDAEVVFLAVGGRSDQDVCTYSDIDMRLRPGRYAGREVFETKDGRDLP